MRMLRPGHGLVVCAVASIGLGVAGGCTNPEVDDGAEPERTGMKEQSLVAWSETWTSPMLISGCPSGGGSECPSNWQPLTYPSGTSKWLSCYASNSSPSMNAGTTLSWGSGWGNFKGTASIPATFASRQRFNRNQFLSVELSMNSFCGRGTVQDANARCHSGLVLYNGEGDYRQVAYSSVGASAGYFTFRKLWSHPNESATCGDASLINGYQFPRNQLHKLRLDYYGHEDGKWVYVVDDIVREISVPAPLRGDPAVELINVVPWDESNAFVQGSFGPVTVWTGSTLSAYQTDASSALWLSDTRCIATAAVNPGANVARITLGLSAGKDYLVQARQNLPGGFPGTLINSFIYHADRTGGQDVPLVIPGDPGPYVWVVVCNANGTTGLISTSTNKVYGGTTLFSVDGGNSWTPVQNDLYFKMHRRE